MSRPTLSIVIPAYRSERTVAASLRSFFGQAYPAEIVVVDSTPEEATALVVQEFPDVHLLRPRERLLPHAARNVGARATTGDLILFTDPDIYAEPGAVEALVLAWERSGGAVAAAVLCHGKSWLDRGLHLAKFDGWLAGSEGRTLDIAPTSGLLCSRADFEAVGGFGDEGLMIADTVFSWALRDAGVSIRFEPRAVFRHDHTQSWRGLLKERFARGREFAGLRMSRPGLSRGKVHDVLTTVTLIRPLLVIGRTLSNARCAGLGRDAWLTLPLTASGHAAWFAGELAGLLGSPEGEKH